MINPEWRGCARFEHRQLLREIRFVAVCIPWAAAHVATGRQDRQRWEGHLKFLAGLELVLENVTERTVLLGDFNQAVPRRSAPKAVSAALERSVIRRLPLAKGER